jgi:phospholipid N-methyltransferase
MSNITSQSWLQLSQNFVAHSTEKILIEQNILQEIPQFKKSTHILIIGPGASNLPQKLTSRGHAVTIIEKEPHFANLYRQHPGITILTTDFETTLLQPDPYDCIIASHVFYYFTDLTKSIQKLRTALRENGKIFLVTNTSTDTYAQTKRYFFEELLNQPYVFTYDRLLNTLGALDIHFTEKMIDCRVAANSVEHLYEILRVWFDTQQPAYNEHKVVMLDYLAKIAPEFFIDYENRLLILS